MPRPTVRHVALVGVLALLAALTVAVVEAAASRRPVLVELVDSSELSPRPILFVANPFRDRAPERPAEELLEGLAAGRPREAIGLVAGDALPGYLDGETRHRLKRWSLIAITDRSADRRDLTYWAKRQGTEGAIDIVSERIAGRWVVTSFSTAY